MAFLFIGNGLNEKICHIYFPLYNEAGKLNLENDVD